MASGDQRGAGSRRRQGLRRLSPRNSGRHFHALRALPHSAVALFLADYRPSRKPALHPPAGRLITRTLSERSPHGRRTKDRLRHPGHTCVVHRLPAAELPSQNKKPKPAEALKHCDVAGSPGVMAANGVCVRLSGYVSAGIQRRAREVASRLAAGTLPGLMGPDEELREASILVMPAKAGIQR